MANESANTVLINSLIADINKINARLNKQDEAIGLLKGELTRLLPAVQKMGEIILHLTGNDGESNDTETV